ncbi:PLP-dependent aminotransferase family protein [Paenibacillus sp. OAS669]|uniref:aminotransferase-like domain-containing protein n=1 Tax=Paenibacillus sp. OAS669 TaxID=2663821 RepID=UPI0019FC9679|nr:PLP-dependent aminotransferase family protein [Paenibacillus sp. OAS669]MBE1446832.1 GntR family transcriptional regulator of abcA and norABC [Paenibacillus sp. OAS669]
MAPSIWMDKRPTKSYNKLKPQVTGGIVVTLQVEWQPDRKSDLPLHYQILMHIKNKIIRGEWPVGTKIPSQRRLAAEYGVNRSTIVMALDELAADGFLRGNRGGGTVVAHSREEEPDSTPPPDWLSYVSSGIQSSNIPIIQEINQAEFRKDVIRLGTGELAPDLLPYKEMKAVLQALTKESMTLGYEEPKGNAGLRQLISQHVEGYGIDASPSSILIVSGALQALHLLSIGLLHRGSTVLLERPSYLYSVPIFQSAGMKLAGVPMDREGIRADLIPMIKKQHNGALLYTIPTFHNPTGTVMSSNRREQLLQACIKEGLPLIEDDVYRELWMDAPPPMPLKAADAGGHVLYLGSFSKSVSPGLRIGWIIGPEPVIDRLADIKMQTDYGASSLSQAAAAQWLASGLYQEHIHALRQQLQYRRSIAVSALEKYFGDLAQWEVPAGGFYIWLHLTPTVPLKSLFAAALKEGILLNPGHLYEGEPSGHLRISYAYASLHDLETGIYRLAVLVKQMLRA